MNCDPNALAQAARCFSCSDNLEGIKSYLLCQWFNAQAAPTPPVDTGFGVTWTPEDVALPALIGKFGFESNSNLAGITALTISDTTNSEGYDFEFCLGLVNISFPNLTAITNISYFFLSDSPALTSVGLPVLNNGPADLITGFVITRCNALLTLTIPIMFDVGKLDLSNNASLQSLSIPTLDNAQGNVLLNDNPLMTSLNISALQTIGGDLVLTNSGVMSLSLAVTQADNIIASTMPNLTDISMTSLNTIGNIIFSGCSNLNNLNDLSTIAVTDGSTWNFSGCNLPDTEVNKILAQWIASGPQTSGLIDTSGGTNQAPSGQGIIDKATLQGQGVTVNTN